MVARREKRRGGAAAPATVGSLTACLVALSMMASTGCTERGAAADVRPGNDGRNVHHALVALHRAPDVLARSGSSRARTSMEMATGGTRVTVQGEGGFDYARRMGRLLVVLPRDAAGTAEHRPVTELLTPGALYMKNRGAGVPPDKWVRVVTSELPDGNLVTGGATDPLAAAELLRGARQVTYIGEEMSEGVPVRHYRGTTDIARAAQVASPHARAALAAAAKGFSQVTVPFDAYLDEQGRLRKVRHQFTFSNTEVASTVVLYDFGSGAEVELPPPADIYAGKIAGSVA
ncbi:hypothetical protein [Streptomyces sp. URMC 123]|uniref:hypothetical protein n=1 Tax=Streptomyces sp. URMC 123 TaxID=3423403 RepID=UPI003F1C53EB